MGNRARLAALVLGWAVCGLSLPAAAQAPLSAIDWLSQSVIDAPDGAPQDEAPIIGTGDALPQDVIVSVLGGPSPDAAGLLPPSKTGLPRDLWGIGRAKDIAATLSAERADVLPSLQALLLTILLAEAAPPADVERPGDLVLARIDKLLSMGALHQAEALIETISPMTTEVFRRRFDVAMLTGTEDAACQDLRAAPDLAPTYPARVFCLARSGDWTAAALTLRMAQALGYVSAQEDALLSRFLDPDLFEGEPLLVPPQPMTPLVWRMLESIGEGVPTGSLPLAFSHAELRETAGWKAQIEAAERLTRAGALPANQLLGIYTERLPAASGGVWDRVEAFQRFETALRTGDPGAVARFLPTVWEEMGRAELEVPFAALFADDLMRLPLPAAESAIAFRIALLSPDYERAATRRTPANATEQFLIGVARGSLLGVTPPDSLARAIAPAFLRATPPPDLKTLLEEDRLGESLLAAIDRIARGLTGDLRGVTDGLALLRQVGLEDVARRTALEVLLLERRG